MGILGMEIKITVHEGGQQDEILGGYGNVLF